MISYELAKQLKDAGFPQNGQGINSQTLDSAGNNAINVFRENVYYPTLSELIEGCHDNCPEFILHVYPHGCLIERPNLDDMRIQSTPEEAVARLYLALNAKDKTEKSL